MTRMCASLFEEEGDVKRSGLASGRMSTEAAGD